MAETTDRFQPNQVVDIAEIHTFALICATGPRKTPRMVLQSPITSAVGEPCVITCGKFFQRKSNTTESNTGTKPGRFLWRISVTLPRLSW